MIRHDKETTKLKIRFDASGKVDVLPSLNDFLCTSPSLTSSLFGVLLSFRVHNIAIVGDFEETFQQISFHPEDRDVIRFLWSKKAKKGKSI